MDTDSREVKANGRVLGAGWKWAKGREWETSVIVSTIKTNKTNGISV